MKKLILLSFLSFLFILSGCKVKKVNYDINQNLKSQYHNNTINAEPDFHRLFTGQIKHNITIEITRSEWNRLIEDMMNYADLYENDLRSDTYFKAKIIYSDIHGKIIIDEVGFRTRGNNSRTLPQNEDGTYNLAHFKLKFDETFDYSKESKNYTALKDRKAFDLKELNLKYDRNNDLSNIGEIHANTLMNLVGIPAPLVTLADLTIKIDNEIISYGLYKVFEPIDKEFIDKRYTKKEAKGNLYKSAVTELGKASLEPLTNLKQIGIKDVSINYRPSYDLKTNKKSPDFSDIDNFINSINNLNDEEFVNYLEQNFEVDNYLRLLAMNALIGNADDYRGKGNNYYLYFNSNTKKFIMIPDDLDQSLGVDKSKFTTYADIYYWRNNSILFIEKETRPLSDKILLIPNYQEKYETYLRDFIEDEIFSYNRFSTTFKVYKEVYPNQQFVDTYVKTFYEDRTTNIKEQLAYYEINRYSKRGDVS